MGILNMVYGSSGQSYKTYSELKAMTLADALAELNTDAQGYYDNLNGNGRMLGIGIANDDKTSYQCWDVSPIIYWNGVWRNGEVIIITMKADSNGDLKIPKAGYASTGTQNRPYNWWVSIDGGSETQYSGGGSASAITIASGLTADSDHTVVIRPNSEGYGWARAFGFHNSGVAELLQSVTYNGSYEGYGNSSTDMGAHFRRGQYSGCTSLTTAPQEALPNSVTTIGNYFRGYQYNGCTSLTTAPQEILPTGITSIGESFRSHQYYGCTSLTTAPQEVLPTGITSIGNYFRAYQYSGCTSLTTAPQEVLPTGITSIGNYFRYYLYDGCTSLTSASQEVLPTGITSIGDSFRVYQYGGCTSLTTAPQEVLPTGITTIGGNFRAYQYSGCTSLTTAPTEVLPTGITTIGNQFRYYQYDGCISLNEIQGLVDLGITAGTNYRGYQYRNCANGTIIKVLSDVGTAWQSNAISNSKISVVLVPNAYLSNFTGATIQPRSSITDSKFVGY